MKKMIIATILPLLFVNSFAFQASPDISSVDISSDFGGVEFPDLDSSGAVDIDDRRLKGDGEKAKVDGKDKAKLGNKKPSLVRGSIKLLAAKKLWKNKGKVVILGGGALIAAGMTKSWYLELIENPEDNEDYMIEFIEDTPKRFSVFHKVVLHNYFTTKDQEYKEKLEYFIDFFNLGLTKKELNKVEMSKKGFKDIETEVIELVKVAHNDWKNDKNRPKCDKSFYENTIMRVGNYRPVPDVIFRSVPNTISENDVDNHEILTEGKKNKNWLTSDHIPSYKAVELFLRNKGVYGYYKDGYLPIKIGKDARKENSLLVNNLTGIFIVSNEHRKYSITFGGNNFESKVKEDAKNLLKATVRDIAFMANKLGGAKDDYLKSAPYIIKRNFYLCLYEIGDNYDYEKLAQ